VRQFLGGSTPSGSRPFDIERVLGVVYKGLCVILIAFLLLSTLRLGLVAWFYSAVNSWATLRLGLDSEASRFVAVSTTVVFALCLPSLIWILVGRNQLLGATLVIGFQAVVFALALSVGKDICFDRSSGATLCYYADTPDGRVMSRTPGSDPKFGISFRVLTSDIATDKSARRSADSLRVLRESDKTKHRLIAASSADSISRLRRADSLLAAEEARRHFALLLTLSTDYDRLKSRFAAIERSLGEREKNMNGLTLRPEIRSTLESTRADLAAAFAALSRADTAMASRRLDRAQNGLKFLEAL
jgi:hypothetical protein